MHDRLIKSLDEADLYLRVRADSKPPVLNHYDIDELKDIAKTCDEAARTLEKAIIPPCKVGDTVWYGWKDGVYPHTVKRIVMDEYGTYVDTGSVFFPLDYFGKCLFFKREEAEAKPKEGAE